MSSVPKVFKKGEFLFKEGDKIQNLMLVQSGSVSLCLVRPKKNIDLLQISANQILGESAISGGNTYTLSAVATTETKILEVPMEALKQGTDQLPQLIKVIIKSLSDRLKMMMTEVRSSKMEKDSSPCPEDQVARIFGASLVTTLVKGKKDEKDPRKYSIDWLILKNYAQRVLGESPKRLEQTLSILSKHKICSFEMGKPPEDPEGPEQIMAVHFADITALEAFVEFYQYYYFKGGKKELLKVDDYIFQIVSNVMKLCENEKPDRYGMVTIDFTKTLETFKLEHGINLNSDMFARMEQKGVFMKRQSKPDGQVLLQMEIKEIRNTLHIWKFLKEIEKWNEKGLVDLNEDYFAKKKAATSGHSCPSCSTELTAAAKFCSNCGHKIAA